MRKNPIAVAKTPPVDFSREVQPLLAKRCFHCHGPDKHEAGLRLDSHESVLAKLESGATAVVPGSDAKSELLRRITSTDENLRMPPEGSKPLTADQIQRVQIRRWVQEGAKWQEHWAFRAPQLLPPPQVKNSRVGKDADRCFLSLASWNKTGSLKPAGQQGSSLIRRAYYDLTGLPPSPAEVDAFFWRIARRPPSKR